jgi:hypothetical protein
VPSIAWTGALDGMLSGKNANMMYDLEPGKTVSLVASATSPSGTDIPTFKWNLYDDNGVADTPTGTKVDLQIEPGHGFARAELTVVDAKMRSETLSISFQACLGAGQTCGYQGSGCCSRTCDSTANTCQ